MRLYKANIRPLRLFLQPSAYTSLGNNYTHGKLLAQLSFGIGNTIATVYARNYFQDIIDLLTWMDVPYKEKFYRVLMVY